MGYFEKKTVGKQSNRKIGFCVCVCVCVFVCFDDFTQGLYCRLLNLTIYDLTAFETNFVILLLELSFYLCKAPYPNKPLFFRPVQECALALRKNTESATSKRENFTSVKNSLFLTEGTHPQKHLFCV